MSVITQLGETALMIAAKEGMTEVVSLLVKAGATLDPPWDEASTILSGVHIGSFSTPVIP